MKSEDEVKAGGMRQTVASPENRNGEALVLHRQSHHGWGEGANVGAVVGILFPPTIVGAAVVGAGGGALVASATEALSHTGAQRAPAVKTQAIAVYRKLGVKSRAEAVRKAHQQGLLSA